MIYLNTSSLMKIHQVSCLTFWSFLNIVNEKRKSEEKEDFVPFLHENLLWTYFQRQVLPSEVSLYWQRVKSKLLQRQLQSKIIIVTSSSNQRCCEKEKNTRVEDLLKICCMRKCFSCCFFIHHLFSNFASHYNSNLFKSQLTRLFSNVIIFE